MIRLLVLCVLFTAVMTSDAVAGSKEICEIAAEKAAAARGIPKHLMTAISQVETGRYDKEASATYAWPWTVTAEGDGRYLPTKEAAVAWVRELQAKGVRNIDVGCMQINLHYHPDAFQSIPQAFDPHSNAEYAADFLSRLYTENGSWMRAAAHYHSRTFHRAATYKAKVVTAWRRVTRAAFVETASGERQPLAKAAASSTKQPSRVRTPSRIEKRVSAQKWREQRLANYYAEKANSEPMGATSW